MATKNLDKEATKILRDAGYTWAGNIRSQELYDLRAEERSRRLYGGMSKKRDGLICRKRRIN